MFSRHFAAPAVSTFPALFLRSASTFFFPALVLAMLMFSRHLAAPAVSTFPALSLTCFHVFFYTCAGHCQFAVVSTFSRHRTAPVVIMFPIIFSDIHFSIYSSLPMQAMLFRCSGHAFLRDY